jgi:hypothetical protein
METYLDSLRQLLRPYARHYPRSVDDSQAGRRSRAAQKGEEDDQELVCVLANALTAFEIGSSV